MLFFGLKVAFIGIGTVFSALIFLIFVIYAISAVAKALEPKTAYTNEKKPDAAVEPNPEILTAANQDDGEIIAVITAAIAAYGQNSSHIRTITRVLGSAAPPWSNAGRVETMNLRQI